MYKSIDDIIQEVKDAESKCSKFKWPIKEYTKVDRQHLKKEFVLYIAEFMNQYKWNKVDARVMELQHSLTLDIGRSDVERNWVLSLHNNENR